MINSRKRRAYLQDFHQTASGQYIYTGPTRAFDGSARSCKRQKVALVALSLCLLAALVAAGCVPAPGAGSCAYVLIPYLVVLLAAVSLLWGVLRWVAGGEPVREYVYTATVPKLPWRALIAAVAAIVTAIGEIVYLAIHGVGDQAVAAAVYLVCQGAEAVAAFTVMILSRRLRYTTPAQPPEVSGT